MNELQDLFNSWLIDWANSRIAPGFGNERQAILAGQGQQGQQERCSVHCIYVQELKRVQVCD